ncbi:MAG: IS4 family transposase [Oleispira sp.]|nr:IS4 family transposase [Oleispira sp.]
MSHRNTVLAQFLKLVPKHEFTKLAQEHHNGQKFRKFTRFDQFIVLFTLQITGRNSIRDVIENLKIQASKLFHIGTQTMSRSSLSRINNDQPWELYQALFYKILARCQPISGKHSFRFHNKLYSMDASTIDLCLSVFPWAKFRKAKGAVKLHAVLDHDGLLPTFIDLTDGKTHEVNIGRGIKLPKGSILTMDRGYIDYEWFQELTDQDVFFVTRAKKNMCSRVKKRNNVNKNTGVSSDHSIVLTSQKGKAYQGLLRKIGYRDPITNKQYYFLTNNFKVAAKTIADIYKDRWQIELFFKWIKQNLKIKSFIGTTKNAVMSQIWVALCTYLLIYYFKWSNCLHQSALQIIQLLQLNWFDRRCVVGLFKPPKSSTNMGGTMDLDL